MSAHTEVVSPLSEAQFKKAQDRYIDGLRKVTGVQSVATVQIAKAMVTYCEEVSTSMRDAAEVARLNGLPSLNITHAAKVGAIAAILGWPLTEQHAVDVVAAMRLNRDSFAEVAVAIETGDPDAVREAVQRAAESHRENERVKAAEVRRERAERADALEAEKARVAALDPIAAAGEKIAAAIYEHDDVIRTASAEQAAAVREFRNALAHVVTFVPTLTEEESSTVALEVGKLLDLLAAR